MQYVSAFFVCGWDVRQFEIMVLRIRPQVFVSFVDALMVMLEGVIGPFVGIAVLKLIGILPFVGISAYRAPMDGVALAVIGWLDDLVDIVVQRLVRPQVRIALVQAFVVVGARQLVYAPIGREGVRPRRGVGVDVRISADGARMRGIALLIERRIGDGAAIAMRLFPLL